MPISETELLEHVQDSILVVVQQQKVPLVEAGRIVRRVYDPRLVDAAMERLEERASSNRSVRSAIVDHDTYSNAPWYTGPIENGHWARYRDLLWRTGAEGLESLDDETTQIVSLLADPHRRGQRRKGLVMGNVQSGKTRNFAGVIAKAADSGYRLVIVLSGMHNNLRAQTQSRLNRQLFDTPGWYPLTDVERDFGSVRKPDELFVMGSVLCAVVKKNTHRLQNLVGMMASVPETIRRAVPVLIVDDEADQATPNSKREHDEVSAINQRLRDLWSTVLTGSYVAYTATPFANVLMDPDDELDLFPSDFITTIDPGDGYFGPERVFGISETADDDDGNSSDGLDMVRIIPSSDSASLRAPSGAEARAEFVPPLTRSLQDAVLWFVAATAIRRVRGGFGHSSMLVHTTHFTDPHFAMRDRLADHVESLKEAVMSDDSYFRRIWDEEILRCAEIATAPAPPWERVRAELPLVLEHIEVIVDNGQSPDRLNYDDSTPRTVIAVGGGTLSRGLTLEGLVVSYFTRTSNTYDTLMQMGRWFGYRPGYEDLPRVWVTEGLDRDYAFLARVEKDLREEIQSVEGSEFTPREVGVRVRAHPGRLEVTSANKMFCAQVVQLGLSGTSNQTFLLDGSSSSVALGNVRAVERMIAGASLRPLPWSGSRYWRQGVDGKRICNFLAEFTVHHDQSWLADPERLEHMTSWISKWASGTVWNVVIAGNSRRTGKDGVTELGTLRIGEETVWCLDRAPLIGSTPQRIDLKAIMSPNDRLADIDPSKYLGQPHTNDVERRRIRRLHGAGNGLVVVYPLSANSKAAPLAGDKQPTRQDMPVQHHQLGFAICFPHVNDSDGREGTFVSVRRTWDVPETLEDESFDDTEGDRES